MRTVINQTCCCVLYEFVSPSYELSVDEIPFESLHVKDVQVKRVSFDAVQFSVCGAYLRLSLVKVGLSACLAVELLYLIRADIE
jgi:hypothetical protein